MTPDRHDDEHRRALGDVAWLRGVDAYVAASYPEAEECFRTAVREDPTMADGWLGLHALRSDVTTALLRMYEHRGRFGEQRARHQRPLSSWYWLGWWVQPVLESERDLRLAYASHLLDGRRLGELDTALDACPPASGDRHTRFLRACRAYLAKDWEELFRHTASLAGDPQLGVEAGLFAGMARVRMQMFDQAVPLLTTALMRCRSEQPQRKELRYWLARAREGQGRGAAAIPLYRAVLDIDPEFMDSGVRLLALAEEDAPAAGPASVSRQTTGAREGQRRGAAPAPAAEALGGTPGEQRRPVGGRRPAVAADGRAARAGQPDGDALEAALAELDVMVGLEPVKAQVRAMTAQLRMARLRSGQGLPAQPPKRHLVFSGPSGTGKTTVARILARVFTALGMLDHQRLVEAQRSDLVGEFLGQTAVKTNRLIDSALGGTLFIDEAYGLVHSGYSKGDAYGDEALQVLLKRAEDSREHLVVILAGYPEGMERLLAANPGLGSRFSARVDFPSYRPAELTAIGELLARRQGDEWDAEALEELRSICGHVVESGWIDELGNGRFLRTLYETSCAFRDLRLAGLASAPTRVDLATLRLPDLMRAYGEVMSGRGMPRPDDQGTPPVPPRG